MLHAACLVEGRPPPLEDLMRVLDQVAKATQCALQAADAAAVHGERHVASAALHAQRAYREGRQSARTMGAEWLLYLTGQRQVRNAIEKAGVGPATKAYVLVAMGVDAQGALDAATKGLGVTSRPVPPNADALARLGARDELDLLERVALLDLTK